jgi:protein phosphatase
MRFTIDAACACNIGKVRRNNEDNFFFDDKCLELDNQGLRNTACFSDTLKNGLCLAIFDGMGGENFGEVASFAAARQLQSATRSLRDYFVSERKYLLKLTTQLNNAIVEAKKELRTERCGSTMVALYFSTGYVYTCNVGDSRAYRLREGEFLQLSVDHIETRPETERKKAPLTQHLGIDPEDMQIEPYVAKGKICKGDTYLLCSDGLTDMLTNFEISDIMLTGEDSEDCVRNLIQAALEHGGRDNITVIVCKIS